MNQDNRKAPPAGEQHGQTDAALYRSLWARLGDSTQPIPEVQFAGPRHQLPSIYDVTGLASASVAAASAAVAEFVALRRGCAYPAVAVERAHAAMAFRSERYLKPLGWRLPPIWGVMSGDYRGRDGFIRLHTNYKHHQEAALQVLGTGAERSAVTAAVAQWDVQTLESAVVDAGGCAAAMREVDAWQRHAQGRHLAGEPLCIRDGDSAVPRPLPALPADAPPLRGLRVLDLTRVIAGPVATRFLAAYGAQVLRLDPPGFQDVPAALPDTTVGKRRAALDLRAARDRRRFEELVSHADVLVHGYRQDALVGLGYDQARLRQLQPALVVGQLNAYGNGGPWCERRGFDSLVQMSCGIAARGQQVAGSAGPHPLPAQALDHGTGYLLATAVIRALTALHRDGFAHRVRLSLAGTAQVLLGLGETGDPQMQAPPRAELDDYQIEAESEHGRLRRVRCPGVLTGAKADWVLPSGPLGVHPPQWS